MVVCIQAEQEGSLCPLNFWILHDLLNLRIHYLSCKYGINPKMRSEKNIECAIHDGTHVIRASMFQVQLQCVLLETENRNEHYFLTTEHNIEMVCGLPICTGSDEYDVGLWLYSGSVGTGGDTHIKVFFLITHPNNDCIPLPYSKPVKVALHVGYPQSSKKSISKTLYPDFHNTTFTMFWTNVDGAILGDIPCYTCVYV